MVPWPNDPQIRVLAGTPYLTEIMALVIHAKESENLASPMANNLGAYGGTIQVADRAPQSAVSRKRILAGYHLILQ